MLLKATEGGRVDEIIALLDAGVNIDATDEVRLFKHIAFLAPLLYKGRKDLNQKSIPSYMWDSDQQH